MLHRVALIKNGVSIGLAGQLGLSSLKTEFLGAIADSSSGSSVEEISHTVHADIGGSRGGLSSELGVQGSDLVFESRDEGVEITDPLGKEDVRGAEIGI